MFSVDVLGKCNQVVKSGVPACLLLEEYVRRVLYVSVYNLFIREIGGLSRRWERGRSMTLEQEALLAKRQLRSFWY